MAKANAFDDRQLAVARVYARSLLDLAEKAGATESVQAELAGVAELASSNADLRSFFGSPVIGTEERRSAIEKVFRGRASDLVVDALQVINRKGRLGLLGAIAESYRQEDKARRGIVDVHVTTAVPISDALRTRLQKALNERSGRQANLVESVNPAIIGGLVLQVEDDKIDASVTKELSKLAGLLVERASQEILSGKSYVTD